MAAGNLDKAAGVVGVLRQLAPDEHRHPLHRAPDLLGPGRREHAQHGHAGAEIRAHAPDDGPGDGAPGQHRRSHRPLPRSRQNGPATSRPSLRTGRGAEPLRIRRRPGAGGKGVPGSPVRQPLRREGRVPAGRDRSPRIRSGERRWRTTSAPWNCSPTTPRPAWAWAGP